MGFWWVRKKGWWKKNPHCLSFCKYIHPSHTYTYTHSLNEKRVNNFPTSCFFFNGRRRHTSIIKSTYTHSYTHSVCIIFHTVTSARVARYNFYIFFSFFLNLKRKIFICLLVSSEHVYAGRVVLIFHVFSKKKRDRVFFSFRGDNFRHLCEGIVCVFLLFFLFYFNSSSWFLYTENIFFCVKSIVTTTRPTDAWCTHICCCLLLVGCLCLQQRRVVRVEPGQKNKHKKKGSQRNSTEKNIYLKIYIYVSCYISFYCCFVFLCVLFVMLLKKEQFSLGC